MIPEDLEALALADAIGALDADEQRDLHARIAALPHPLQEQVGRLYDTALSLAAATPSVAPSSDVRERLLARIDAPSRYTVAAQEGEWKESGLPGLTMRVLAVDRARGSVTMLIRGEAGATYPAHRHSGAEECYVISGTVLIDGRTLGPGDFHHADADSDHGEIVTPTGAEVLIVGAIADYLG
jgi:anti-sigma factor ChrR (cupin superfamily)